MRRADGFTLIEVLVSVVIVAFAMLALAHAFTSGYLNVVREGRDTMALTAARQALEDCKGLPLGAIAQLDGFDTASSSSLPPDAPARDVARRLRYAVAGEGSGFSFDATERARWTRLRDDDGEALGGRGTIATAPQGAGLTRITVSVDLPGQARPVTLSTLVNGL